MPTSERSEIETACCTHPCLVPVVLAFGTIILGLVELPMVTAAWGEITGRAILAAASSIGVGFLVLGMLPSIERVFNITTGMTLAELRDPRRPLLQQLQLRAPGTYNHSLQVANIAEAAADAVGADSLLAYVGALYHDIGEDEQAGVLRRESWRRPQQA